MMTKQTLPKQIEGTNRIEAFSDGVFAIIVTLLIFEVKVPVLDDLSNSAVLDALIGIVPKGLGFAISFLQSLFSGSVIIIFSPNCSFKLETYLV